MLKITSYISLIFVFIGLLMQSAQADEIKLPAACFQQNEYCSTADIQHDANGIKFINVKFHARVANEYSDDEELVKRFIHFQAWRDYTAGAEAINIISSGLLNSQTSNGKRELTQYARYLIKAPWPVNQIEVVERTTFREKKSDLDKKIFWTFHSDRDFAHKGIKRKDGSIKVQFNAPLNVYYVEVNLEIVPTTALLSAARKPIEKAMAQLFMGMFNIK